MLYGTIYFLSRKRFLASACVFELTYEPMTMYAYMLVLYMSPEGE